MVINQNYSKLKQPENTNTFSLNTVTDISHNSSDASEQGNTLCLQLPDNIVGNIKLGGNRDVIFTTDNRISLVDFSQCTITTLQQDDGFNFTEEYVITGSYRVVRGCEDVIYFSDHNNPNRFYNISRPEKHETLGIFDITKTLKNAQIVHPTITTTILNNSGQVEFGVYNFAIQGLTSNEDVIFTSEVDINYTPIIYNQVEGALNLATNLPDIGGKPISNKAIKLNITNIPEDVTLIRIIVFRHITSDGLTSDAHIIGELIPNTGSTLEYIYRGFNIDNGDFLVDKNEYLVPKAIYPIALDNLQVESRLLEYNLKEANRNYDEYQFYASKICSKYVVKEVAKNDPNFYLLNRTLLGGEIILLCINYVHGDGTVSNSYPLIGRSKLPNDEVLVDDIFNSGQQVEKWQLFDTSIKDSTPIDGYVSSGEFGYYESSQLYSNPPNYCGSNYWGFDCSNTNLEDTPVRLFIVPDRAVEPHDDGDNIRPIGIWFDEDSIEYPNDDVVGHYFSIVVVNQSNIEAKGLGVAEQYYIDSEGRQVIPHVITGGNTPNNIFNFHSANHHILDEYVNGTHIGIEGYWEETQVNDDEEFQKLFNSGLPYDQIHIWLTTHEATPYTGSAENPITLNKSIVVPSSTEIDNVVNTNYTIDYNILEVPDGLTEPILKYISVKNNINPIPNIWSITTRRITNLNETVSFNGDNFISELVLDDIFDFNVEGVDNYEFALKFIKFGPYAFLFGNEGLDLDAYVEILKGFYIESRVNIDLRHLGTDECNKHFQNTDNKAKYFLDKLVEPYNENYKLRDSFCQFFAGYNKDYSYIQDLNKYRNLGFTFDYCSECLNVYPNRIIFSLPSFEEDLSDNYRINKANDYIDIPAHTGAIIKIDYKDGKLWIRTERACWLLQPNPQQLELSESTVQIGTGDFLSIPARELNVTPTGYGGQQHKLNSINCEKGLIWVDNNRKEFYWSHGEFTEIHEDLEKWFGDNITANQFRFGYDPLHSRIVVTHKDLWTLSYCLKEKGWKSWHSYIPDWYLYSTNTFYSVYSNELWEHNKGNFTTYYDLEFPHIVEMIIKSEGNTFLPQSIIYHANTYDLSNGYEQDVIGITYDQFLAYNDTQSTGLQTLLFNEDFDVYYDNMITHVKQTDRNYKISPLKDLSTSSNIWTTDITPIKIGVNGYMDKLPVVDVNRNMVDITSFKSKWIAVRLYFNQHTYKISLEFETGNLQKSIR